MNFGHKRMALAVTLFLFIPTFSVSARETPKVIHVFVALCDNLHQGIVPVPKKLGNGDDPKNNLYWGALYGVKTFFKKSSNWELTACFQRSPPILERCIFKHQRENVYLVADAYQGKEIRRAIIDYLNAVSGNAKDSVSVAEDERTIDLGIHGNSHLVIYVGHDGLMDFKLDRYPERQDSRNRDTMILACMSRTYFREAVTRAGVIPLLWTTGLMAPEAYTIENAIEGWILGESKDNILSRAAKAYSKYQKCGVKAAKRLFRTHSD